MGILLIMCYYFLNKSQECAFYSFFVAIRDIKYLHFLTPHRIKIVNMAAENLSVRPGFYSYTTYKGILHFLKYESELPVLLFPTARMPVARKI